MTVSNPIKRAKRLVRSLASENWAITDTKAQEIISFLTNEETGHYPSAQSLLQNLKLAGQLGDDDEDDEDDQYNRNGGYVINGNIALVGVEGVIMPKANLMMRFSGGTSSTVLRNSYNALKTVQGIDTVITIFDSPGGAVIGVEEAAQALAELSAIKHTVAVCDNGTMASAAFWLAAHANERIVTRSCETGSIGILSTVRNQQGSGLVVVRSGSLKAIGAGPITAEQLKHIQERVDKKAEKFFAVVSERTGVPIDTIRNLQGREITGEEAMELGLVTGLDVMSNVIDKYKKKEIKMAGEKQTAQSNGQSTSVAETISTVASKESGDTTNVVSSTVVETAKEVSNALTPAQIQEAVNRINTFNGIAKTVLTTMAETDHAGYEKFVESAIQSGMSSDEFAGACVKKAASYNTVIGNSQKDRLSSGESQADKVADMISDAMTLKAFNGSTEYKEYDPESRDFVKTKIDFESRDSSISKDARRLSGMPITQLVRVAFQQAGYHDAMHMTPSELWDFGMGLGVYRGQGMYGSSPVLHTPGSLPKLWENILDKRIRAAYVGVPATFKTWATKVEDANDFRQRSTVRIGEAGLLRQATDEEGLDYDVIGEAGLKYRVARYQRGWGYSKEAFINDNAGFFTRLPAIVGPAPNRTFNKIAYGLLSENPSFDGGNGTGRAFNNTAIAATGGGHDNDLGTGSFDATMLNNMFIKLQKQTALNTTEPTYLGLNLDLVIIGATDWQAAATLQVSTYKDSTSNAANVWGRTFDILIEPEVEAYNTLASATIRYGLDRSLPFIEYCYLNGYATPRITTDVDWETGNFRMKMEASFGISWVDYRPIVRHGITAVSAT